MPNNWNTNVDFVIISESQVPGISLVYAQNEDSFEYLEETHFVVLDDGAARIWRSEVGDFISDAHHAFLTSDLA